MNSTQGLWARAVSAGGVAWSEYTHRPCGHGQSLQEEWQGQSTHTGLVDTGSLCRGSGRVRVHTQGLWARAVSAGGVAGSEYTHRACGRGSVCRGSGRVNCAMESPSLPSKD